LGAAPGDATGEQVTLGQHLLDRPTQVWEAALGRSHPLLEPGKAGHLARDGVVVHQVGGEQGIQGVEVSRIDRLNDAVVGDFMLLHEHP